MGSRPSKAALRQDLVLHNNATGFLKSPNTLIAPKIANGFTTPRSRGRPAMYSMARTPYATSPSTFTRKGITSSYGREEALTSSRSAFQHGGKMALKRRSSILDDDIGSGGPLRRIRQKANLLMLRDKRELRYTTLQQPDHASQKLLLINEFEPKTLRELNKIETQACMVWDWSRAMLMYLGIQQVVFGGRSMGDWEEGIKTQKTDTSPLRSKIDMIRGG
ncbi:hypothetical protein Tco_1227224 [Tanacetum coccineum]